MEDNKKKAIKEITKLVKGLMKREITFSLIPCHDGYKVDCGDWDAIWNHMSYGYQVGKLEISADFAKGYNNIEGWLTAKEILERLDNKNKIDKEEERGHGLFEHEEYNVSEPWDV